MKTESKTIIGIDDMAFHVPKIFLSIKELAGQRKIEYAKLNEGLGLEAMSLADVHEDAATMAANAVKSLIEKNNLSPQSIGRIYVGSESLIDGSKPIASYVLSMLSDYFEKTYGKNAFLHTDAVDLTFACIGGVDALHNTLDWVRADDSRVGIVVCTDNAKYELESTGEYTQGAGAVAVLVKSNPRLISIEEPIGVATVGVHDFFKPLRRLNRNQLAASVKGSSNGASRDFSIPGILSTEENYIDVHKIFPVFDGRYSNECYANRMNEAYTHFCRLKANHKLSRWNRIIFHLPYAFHGKRVFMEIFFGENSPNPEFTKQLLELDSKFYEHKTMKTVAQTPLYRQFVKEKIENGQRASSLVGNMYTGSIFLSLMSMLEIELNAHKEMENMVIGFCAYGSGSKSKVFEGTVQKQWKTAVKDFRLFETLAERKAIDFELYEDVHGARLSESISPPENEFYLKSVSTSETLYGERTYGFAEKSTIFR